MIKGTKGNDVLKGTSGNDIFNLTLGGNDTAIGFAGNDTFQFGATFTAKDSVNGGAGNDVLSLAGDYSGSHAVIFGAKTALGVETINLGAQHNYKLTTNDATVAKNKMLTVDASKLGAANALSFNGAQETNGKFDLIGGKGNDLLAGGAKNDMFVLTHGGNDTANGGAGNDTFNLSAFLTAADKINGGAGNDVLNLNGTYTGSHALTFGGTAILGVEKIVLGAGHNYALTTADATVAAGAILTIDASGLGSGNFLKFDGSHETDGTFHITGGAGADTVTMGYGEDSHLTFNGGDGSDTLAIKAIDGNDTLDITLNGLTSVEHLTLLDAGPTLSLNIAVDDSVIAAGQTLSVDGSALSAPFFIDGTAETNGGFNITGSAHSDSLTIGSAAVLAASTYDGGDGTDDLVLNGNFSTQQTLTGITNVEYLSLTDGHDYNLKTNDANVVSGGTLTVNASALTTGHTLTFDGSAETNGGFHIIGSAAADVIDITGRAVFLASSIDGGDNGDFVDMINLNGDFSTQTNLTSSIITNVELLNLAAGHDYNFKVADGTVASGAYLQIEAEGLGASDTVHFDAHLDTQGTYYLYGGAGDDVMLGGQNGSAFGLGAGGTDTLTGGAGNDTVYAGGGLDGTDIIDGGAGFNYINVETAVTQNVTFGASSLTNIDELQITQHGSPTPTFSYTMNDANVAAGGSMIIDGSGLGATNTLTFNGSAELDGTYTVKGGAGNDVITGGLLGDTLTGGLGADTFTYTSAAQSQSTNYDKITDVNFSSDKFDLSITVAGANDQVSGSVSTASFDTDIAGLAGGMGAHHAVVVAATSGSLSGHDFLVVDYDGSAAYNSGDLVIDITGHTGTLTTSDFI